MMMLIGGGRARGGFSYVDNVATAMMAAAASPNAPGHAYNLCDETGLTWREYTDALADALGYKRAWLALPFPAAMALGATMEFPYRLLKASKRPLLTRHAAYLLGREQEFPAARAREDFGFEPRVSFAEGLARSAEWVRSRASGAA
jgi:nucleoside-diphosphate-sugar epimerase